MVKQIVASQSEKKYYDEAFTGKFGHIGSVAGTSGHALIFLNMPAQGTGITSRVGNKIRIKSVHTIITISSGTAGNINPAIGGDLYLVSWAEGGNFLISDFLGADATSSGVYTNRSQRNVERFSEFRVLRKIKFQDQGDNYQAQQQPTLTYKIAWTGDIPVSFNSGASTPLQNQLAYIFVASNGSVVGGTGLTYQCNSRVYYTDS